MKSKELKINLLLTFLSLFVFIIILNFILFFSNKQIHQTKISKNIMTLLPIEMSYYYSDTYNKLENINVILGDSHAFGSGDAFLNDDYNYSIGHFLYNHFEKKKNFLNIGFPGAGSQKIYHNYLNFKKKTNIKPNKIIYLFYEGNDLENNIKYKNKNSFVKKLIKIKYYFPIVTLTENLLTNIKNKIINKINKTKNVNTTKNKSNRINFKNNINILDLSLQSPPIELSDHDLNLSLNIFFKTLTNLKDKTKDIILVYLPAPTSILNLENPIYFQKYFNKNNQTSSTKEELERLSKNIRLKIKNFSLKQEIKFLDMTDILKKKSLELEIYGPKDYKHFNKYGYKIISNQIFKNY